MISGGNNELKLSIELLRASERERSRDGAREIRRLRGVNERVI